MGHYDKERERQRMIKSLAVPKHEAEGNCPDCGEPLDTILSPIVGASLYCNFCERSVEDA